MLGHTSDFQLSLLSVRVPVSSATNRIFFPNSVIKNTNATYWYENKMQSIATTLTAQLTGARTTSSVQIQLEASFTSFQ